MVGIVPHRSSGSGVLGLLSVVPDNELVSECEVDHLVALRHLDDSLLPVAVCMPLLCLVDCCGDPDVLRRYESHRGVHCLGSGLLRAELDGLCLSVDVR